MPNWCQSRVCFEGSLDNISKLAEDMYKAIKYRIDNNYHYTNIWYLLSLKDFNTEEYNKSRYGDNYFTHTNFRGSVETFDTRCPIQINYYGDYAKLHLYFETAWYMDYNVLHLICMLYNVKFSAYSEEPGMCLYNKCRNAEIDDYDYDYVIYPDCEELEEAMEKDKYFEIDYTIPVKNGQEKYIIETLNQHNISYKTIPTDQIDDSELSIYGVYYDTSE